LDIVLVTLYYSLRRHYSLIVVVSLALVYCSDVFVLIIFFLLSIIVLTLPVLC